MSNEDVKNRVVDMLYEAIDDLDSHARWSQELRANIISAIQEVENVE